MHAAVACAAARRNTRSMVAPGSEFADIGSLAAAALRKAGVRRSFPNNGFIYLQDDEARHLFFVEAGHVRLSYLMEDGSAVLHTVLPPGQCFGELGVFENSTYCDMATAIGSATVVAVPATAFRALSDEHPPLELALSRLVGRRYRSYIALTRDLSLRSLPGRLAQAMLRLSDALGTTASHEGRTMPCIGAVVTQTDLGLMARGSRGNVNRALKSWERAGWIALTGRSIVILNRPRLEAVAVSEDL